MLIDDEVKKLFLLYFEIICMVKMKFKLILKMSGLQLPFFMLKIIF